jgi:sugar/nucleoside kinase (ribokinase family)
VLVFGSVCIDRLRRIPQLPSVGSYVEILSEDVMLGGEAANTANALRSWGHPLMLAGNATGGGPEGQLLRSMLDSKGIPTDWLGPAGDSLTPVCDVYLTPDGERTMFGRGFADAQPALPLEALPYSQADWFTAEPNMGKPARDVVRLAHEAGNRIYLMDFIQSDEPIFPGSFWQCSTDWAGKRGDVDLNIEWVRNWVARYHCSAILSDGPGGFVFGSPSHAVRHYPPFPAPRVVDTTGAGDMFRAGMLYGLESGWTIAQCLRFASAAGCLKCGYLGATSYVPSLQEIMAFIEACPDVSEQYD